MRFRIAEALRFERDVKLRLPFRFGVVTLTEAPQCFLRVRIETENGRSSWGASAELLAPKWFDKDPALSNEDNFDQLRGAVDRARAAYPGRLDTAFGHHAAYFAAALAGTANPLVESFGPALLDRAVLDALGRLLGRSFYDLVRSNLVGFEPTRLCPDLAGADPAAFLAGLEARGNLEARHTVGLVDPITTTPTRVDDGLPETLTEVVEAYGHRWFKLKVGGDLAADLARLGEIAAVLDRLPDYRVSLDGNEQYENAEAVVALWRRLAEQQPRLAASVAFIEQPITRKVALERPIGALAACRPVIIDESDGDYDAFPRALALGYAGVSSKQCKGVWRSLANLMRCRRQPGAFMSGEDLSTQAGLAVQQDLALVALLGIGHVERNGHHYVDGMAGAPPQEQDAFLAGHPDLYHRDRGRARLRIEQGRLAIGSLAGAGFAARAHPDWTAMRTCP